MANASVVELDGLIYVTGKIKKSQNHASNFWCYDPNRNVWTEKAHTNLNAELVVLVKVDGSICICQNKLGFYKYAVALDRWTKVFVYSFLLQIIFLCSIILLIAFCFR